jgi:hypothetical protein
MISVLENIYNNTFMEQVSTVIDSEEKGASHKATIGNLSIEIFYVRPR